MHLVELKRLAREALLSDGARLRLRLRNDPVLHALTAEPWGACSLIPGQPDVEGGDPVPPPELPRDAPVADVVLAQPPKSPPKNSRSEMSSDRTNKLRIAELCRKLFEILDTNPAGQLITASHPKAGPKHKM